MHSHTLFRTRANVYVCWFASFSFSQKMIWNRIKLCFLFSLSLYFVNNPKVVFAEGSTLPIARVDRTHMGSFLCIGMIAFVISIFDWIWIFNFACTSSFTFATFAQRYKSKSIFHICADHWNSGQLQTVYHLPSPRFDRNRNETK